MPHRQLTIDHRPLVSVIIVNYNAGKHLEDSIKSVNRFRDTEVIVIDNSPPRSNLGFSKAVNQGVAQSRGEYICLLNPDAVLTPGSLEQMIDTLKAYQDRALVAPRLLSVDGTNQPSCYRPQTIWHAIKEFWLGQKGSYSKYLPTHPGPVHAAVAACWLVPRTVWDELGGLDEKFFLYFEDLDFCDRANAAGIPVVYDSRAVVTHIHGASSSANPRTTELFIVSAKQYHGVVKKILIDAVIRLRDLCVPPASWKKLSALFTLTTLFYLAVAAVGYFLLPSRQGPLPFISDWYKTNFLLWSWGNFDGEHYLSIARSGYETVRGQSEYAFFPLYPVLINLISRTGLDIYFSAHLVTLGAAVGAVFAVAKWAASHVRNQVTAVWLLLLSPGAIFLAALYTEPLFVLLAALTFIFAERREWGRATLMTALATATRVNGVFLALFLLIKLLHSGKSFLISNFYFLISLTGFFAYMVYLYFATGDPLAWYRAQSGWGKSDPTWPWVTFSRYLTAVTTGWQFDLVHLVVAIEVILTISLVYLTFRLLRLPKTDPAYKWYTLGNLALPLMTGSLGSMPRFALTLLPLLLVFPALTVKGKAVWLTLSLTFCLTGIILFTRGYWYA